MENKCFGKGIAQLQKGIAISFQLKYLLHYSRLLKTVNTFIKKNKHDSPKSGAVFFSHCSQQTEGIQHLDCALHLVLQEA